MSDSNDEYPGYVRDVFYLIREMAAKARTRRLSSQQEDGFDAGCEAELINVLRLMQVQAQVYDFDRKRLGMEGFDPLTDELDPDPRRKTSESARSES